MIYLMLADGFEEIEALVPLDILRRGGCEVQTVGVGGREITGAHEITVRADILPEDISLSKTEMLILPGGGRGVDNLKASQAVRDAVGYAVGNKLPVGAICAGPALLAGMGLLRGINAVCFPACAPELEAGGAMLSELPVCEDGIFITAKGAGVSIPFGLALLARAKGKETAIKTGKNMQCEITI